MKKKSYALEFRKAHFDGRGHIIWASLFAYENSIPKDCWGFNFYNFEVSSKVVGKGLGKGRIIGDEP